MQDRRNERPIKVYSPKRYEDELDQLTAVPLHLALWTGIAIAITTLIIVVEVCSG